MERDLSPRRLVFLLRGGNRLQGCDDELTARDFHLILGVFLIWIAIEWLVLVPLVAVRRLAVSGILFALGGATIGALALLRRGRRRAAAMLFLTVTWCAVEGFTLFRGVLQSQGSTGALVLVLTAAWLLGTKAALTLTGATLLLSLTAAVLQRVGLVAPIYFSGPSVAALTGQIGISVVAVGSIFGVLEALKRQVSAACLSEERFRGLSNASLEGLMIHGRGAILDANLAFARLFGHGAPGELIGANDFELQLTPESRGRLRDRIQAKAPGLFEVTGVRGDGAMFQAEAETRAITHMGHEATLVAFRDITERRRAETALYESEERWKYALEGAGDGVWDWDARTGRVHYSRQWKAMLGYADDEIGDEFSEWRDRVHPDDRDSTHAALRAHLEGRTPGYASEHRVLCKDGTFKWILDRGKVIRRGADGEPVRVIGTHCDITERRRAEAALRESEERRDAVIRTAMDGFWVVDTQGRVLEVNDTYCRMSGYSTHELLTMSISDLEAVEQEADTAARIRGIVTKSDDRFESRHRRKDGSTFDVEVSAQHRPTDSGRVVAFLRDITGRKLAEEATAKLQAQFYQAQKMESVGRLAGGVAHDFNNLLTVINGYSQLLLGSLNPADPIRHHVEQVHLAGERAAGLTRQLLAFSRKQVLEPRTLDLNGLVEQMRPMLTRLVGEDVEVRIALDPKPVTVHADRHQLEQVILNLTVNARDAMRQGGRLLIETAIAERSEDCDRSHREAGAGRFAVLSVSDTGTGMSDETRSRIFEPFFTTKGVGAGTGLGLSMVQGVVAQSGGFIEVSSAPAQGTTFHINLPYLADAADEEAVAAAAPARGSGETVLVVEDQAEVRKYAVAVLRDRGYRVFAAESASEALRLCAREQMDLVVTDVVMPNMSGRELAGRLQVLHPDAKVLFVSGYADDAIGHNRVEERGDTVPAEALQPGGTRRQSARGAGAVGNGAPGETRTPDLLVRSQPLYPTELRARVPSILAPHPNRAGGSSRSR